MSIFTDVCLMRSSQFSSATTVNFRSALRTMQPVHSKADSLLKLYSKSFHVDEDAQPARKSALIQAMLTAVTAPAEPAFRHASM